MSNNKKPLIFISHSSKNKEKVQLLANLLTSINLLPGEQVFCSSLPGFDIPIKSNNRIFDFLRDCFLKYDIHVIFIHSHEYYESAVCLNEMGAAWALKSNQTSFLLPGFNFNEMKGVVNDDSIAIKLDNDVEEVKDKLNQLRSQLTEEFSLPPIPDITWEQSRNRFIELVNVKTESAPNNTNKLREIQNDNETSTINGTKDELIQLFNKLYGLTCNYREAVSDNNIKQINEYSKALKKHVQRISFFSERNKNKEKLLSEMASDVVQLFHEYLENYNLWKQLYTEKNEAEIQKMANSSFQKVVDKALDSLDSLM